MTTDNEHSIETYKAKRTASSHSRIIVIVDMHMETRYELIILLEHLTTQNTISGNTVQELPQSKP